MRTLRVLRPTVDLPPLAAAALPLEPVFLDEAEDCLEADIEEDAGVDDGVFLLGINDTLNSI